MKQRDNRLYLQHILDSISTIGEYIENINEDSFRATRDIPELQKQVSEILEEL